VGPSLEFVSEGQPKCLSTRHRAKGITVCTRMLRISTCTKEFSLVFGLVRSLIYEWNILNPTCSIIYIYQHMHINCIKLWVIRRHEPSYTVSAIYHCPQGDHIIYYIISYISYHITSHHVYHIYYIICINIYFVLLTTPCGWRFIAGEYNSVHVSE
jgi:hypothetical protein